MDGLTTVWRPAPAARMRLFCAPHAGGGAGAYRAWAGRLAPDIEVVAVRPPGRESRLREAPYTELEPLVADLVEELRPRLDKPHAWFGHSLGALVAFESCRALRDRALAEPVRLFVSGRPAPHLPLRLPPVHDAPEPVLRRRLRELDGTPDALLAGRGLGRLLTTLRADLRISELYRFRPGPPLDCPITVLGGTLDPYTAPGDLAAWAGHTSAGCDVAMVRGGHFFLHEQPDTVHDLIRHELTARSPR